MTYAHTEIDVIRWGEARGIVQNSTPYAQALKTKEELEELFDAIAKGDLQNIALRIQRVTAAIWGAQ